MDCIGIQEKLSAYLDYKLTEEEKFSVDEHMLSCPDCGQALEELKKTITHISNLEESEPPAWLEQKIIADIREVAEDRKLLYKKIFSFLHIHRPLQAFAAIAVLIMAITVFRTIEPQMKRTPVEIKQEVTIEKGDDPLKLKQDLSVKKKDVTPDKDMSKEESVLSGFGSGKSIEEVLKEKIVAKSDTDPGEREKRYSAGKKKLSDTSDLKAKWKAAETARSPSAQPPQPGAAPGIVSVGRLPAQTKKTFDYKNYEVKKKIASESVQKTIRFAFHGAAVSVPQPTRHNDEGTNLKKEIVLEPASGTVCIIDLKPVLEIRQIDKSERYWVTVDIVSHSLNIPESLSVVQRNELKTEVDSLVRSLNEWKRELDQNEILFLNNKKKLTVIIEDPLLNFKYLKYKPMVLTIYRGNTLH